MNETCAQKLGLIAYKVPEVFASGKNKGIEEGQTQGFSLGRHQQYIDFWNSFTENWTRTTYRYSMGGDGWNANTFNPPQTLKPTNAQYMFYAAAITKVTKNQLDLSNNTNSTGVFYACTDAVEIDEIDTRKSTSLNYLLYSCSALVTAKLILSENNTFGSENTFYRCSALKDLTIEGTIAKNGFNIQWSTELTHDSLISILNALEDKTGASGTWEITFGDANIAKLTDAEQEIPQQKGWVLS